MQCRKPWLRFQVALNKKAARFTELSKGIQEHCPLDKTKPTLFSGTRPGNFAVIELNMNSSIYQRV